MIPIPGVNDIRGICQVAGHSSDAKCQKAIRVVIRVVQVVQDCVPDGDGAVIGQLRFLSITYLGLKVGGYRVRCQFNRSQGEMNVGRCDLWTSCDLLVMLAM